jgi:predicted permease
MVESASFAATGMIALPIAEMIGAGLSVNNEGKPFLARVARRRACAISRNRRRHGFPLCLIAFGRRRLPASLVGMTVVLAALPTGTGPYMLAEFYRREGQIASRTILLSTLGSIVTLTILLAYVGPAR